jgi:hypothetical protein
MNSYRTGALDSNRLINKREEDEKNKRHSIAVPKTIITDVDNEYNSNSQNSKEIMISKSAFLSPTSSTYEKMNHNKSSNDQLYVSHENLDASLSSIYRSSTSLAHYEDPWKTSSIGIKCISYKPIGCVFLTRKIVELTDTDGKQKIKILYSYTKADRDKLKVPSIGSSIENCSFSDTITLDFDPDSTLFDLVMDVHIITQGATLERSDNQNFSLNAIEQSSIKNPLSSTNNQIVNRLDIDDEDDRISFTSSYDIKYLRPGEMKEKAASEIMNPQIEYKNNDVNNQVMLIKSNYNLLYFNFDLVY